MVLKKKFVTGLLSAVMVLSMSTTAFAGQWLSDANGWWWKNDDGSYPTNSWQWIDGNSDGISESYYFNEQGYCLIDTTTPDGYQVNSSGAWILDGVVQIKETDITANPLPSAVFCGTKFTPPVNSYTLVSGLSLLSISEGGLSRHHYHPPKTTFMRYI